MKFYHLSQIERLLVLVRNGEPVPPEVLEQAEAAIRRERGILERRVVTHLDNLSRAGYPQLGRRANW